MLLTNNAEGGVNTAVPTASDTGSGTSWSSVTVDTNRITYSNDTRAHGALSYKFTQNTAGLGLFWNSTVMGTLTEHYGRFYAYVTGTPTASNKFVRGTSGGQSFGISLGSTAKIFVKNTSDTTIWQSNTVLAFNTWFRVEWHLVHNAGTGTLEVRIFTNPDSASYIETSGNISGSYLNNITSLAFGPANASPAIPLHYIDDMAVADSANGWIGPAALPAQGNFIGWGSPV